MHVYTQDPHFMSHNVQTLLTLTVKSFHHLQPSIRTFNQNKSFFFIKYQIFYFSNENQNNTGAKYSYAYKILHVSQRHTGPTEVAVSDSSMKDRQQLRDKIQDYNPECTIRVNVANI